MTDSASREGDLVVVDGLQQMLIASAGNNAVNTSAACITQCTDRVL